MKGLGRPKEFICREEDFQQWSKKTRAFFAGVTKKSEIMLEWVTKQLTEIMTTAIDLEYLPTETNEDRGVQNLEFALQHMHTAIIALKIYEANGIVANSRKNPLEAWWRLQKRFDSTTGGRKTKPSAHVQFSRCSLLEFQAGIERWESHVSRFQKKMRDKLDDEIKLAGLESLVPKELEKHLILNSNRLRTFEDARLGVVMCVEVKFGLRTPSRMTRVLGDTQVPWMLMRSILALLAREKVVGDRCFSAVQHMFNEIAMHTRHAGKHSTGKGKQSKSWSKSEGKGKSKENKGKSKRTTAHTGKTSKTCLSGLQNLKSDASSDTEESVQTCPTDTSWNDGRNWDEWNDGWSFDEWKNDWSSVGWDEGWEQTYGTSASSFSFGGLDIGATSRRKWFEWVKINEPGHRSCSEHMSMELCSRRSRRRKISSDCQW